MWAIIESAFELVAAFVDFLAVSSVSVPVLYLVGIILVAFLLGLLLGWMTKRTVYKGGEHAGEPVADRVLLDFERLTPLGPSQEKAAENTAMDIADLRVDRMHQQSANMDLEAHEEPSILKE